MQRARPKSVASYTLVLKRSSAFIPTYWGVTIDDHDRAYFLLDKLPNNRLNPKRPESHLRLLCEGDLGSPGVVGGVDALDRVAWEERLWDMRSSERERRTYLAEVGNVVVGYVTFVMGQFVVGEHALMIDEVVVSQDHQDQKHGSALMRWAETMARQSRCQEIRLWAIEDQVGKYKHLGYSDVAGAKPMVLDGHNYTLMSKRVIYHI